MVENTCMTNLEILKQSQTSIKSTILGIQDASLSLIGNDDLQTYLTTAMPNQTAQLELESSIRSELTRIMEANPSIRHISIYNETEIILQAGEYWWSFTPANLDEVSALEGRILWLPAQLGEGYYSREEDIYEVVLTRVINDYYKVNTPIAYEKITLKESSLASLYSGLATENTLEFYIMNSAGDIVSSINKELLGHNVNSYNYFKEILTTNEGYIKDNISSEVISFYYIKEADWYVVKIDKLVNDQIATLITNIMLLCALIGIFFGLCFFYIQRKLIINPLVQLSKEVRRFRVDNYEIETFSNSKDEIGDLNKSFQDMIYYIQDLIERIYKSQLREKDAQLKYLQSQINPHFLYNTLDSMRWMALAEGQTEIAKQMEALSNLFKHALNQGKQMTTLENEILHLENYLIIIKNKFGKRLKVDIRISTDIAVETLYVPHLILQPLVENAIVHGIEPKLGYGIISIEIKESNKQLLYIVSDNGLGANQEEVRDRIKKHNELHNALALHNIDERIKLKYGKGYGILFESEKGSGSRVTVTMPFGGKTDDTINC